ncbi:MAG: hypothetical protein ACYDHU_00300 [Acidimicrobiales bacterium]
MGLFDRRDGDGTRRGQLRESGGDASKLVIAYLKQETLGPLKGLGRFVMFGIAGSMALCVGLVLLAVGFLRLLQGETGSTFAGHLSWVPYAIVAVAGLAVIGLAAWRVGKGPAARRMPSPRAIEEDR